MLDNEKMFTKENPNYKSFVIIIIIFFVFDISLIINLLIIYIRSKKYDKDLTIDLPIPDNITGIKSFTFTQNSERIIYKEGMSHLGNTSNVDYNCYTGRCQKVSPYYPDYDYYYSSLKSFYHEDDEDYTDYYDFECAKDCYINQGKYCYSCPKDYESREGKCNFEKNTYYSSSNACFANYLILKWKGYLYSSENISNSIYQYLDSAILPNENCPDYKKLCGVLDESGNKFCVPKDEDSPINRIIVSDTPPKDEYNYVHIQFNNLSLYYTNEAVETGRIIEGLYVDSDYYIQYEGGCEILEQGIIQEVLDDNGNIYKERRGKKVDLRKKLSKIL